MGTRHLIAVFVDGEYKVAQYGQWDGDPEGQGVGVLEFLRGKSTSELKHRFEKVSWLSEREYKAKLTECGADPESPMVSFETSEEFNRRFPHLSRNAGSDVLSAVWARSGQIKLQDSLSFAGDSLFREYAYVIDLDASTLEVYQGFNQSPLPPSERFHGLTNLESRDGYYPVKLWQSFSLAELPTKDEFLAALSEDEEGVA